ncbi:Hypothetical protein, putative [Bodo saltans]|uniref:F-box domain-containing protein n=1 Tax=Bodo saltans TaxID=75058 RepID=A0A0S4JK01_BODSA|nr:Hypothetical protein, putative [Bodo saltans]|eukprot:CUG91828.1 Hypothetical protein, putative [Bodo saltans]
MNPVFFSLLQLFVLHNDKRRGKNNERNKMSAALVSSRLQSLPLQVFSEIAEFLGAKQIGELSFVCRTFNAIVQSWKAAESVSGPSQHPLAVLMQRRGFYWLLKEGLYFSKTFSSTASAVQLTIEAGGFDAEVATELGDSAPPAIAAESIIYDRSHAATVMVGRAIYRFGGRILSGRLRTRTCYVIDPVARTARSLPPMMAVRSAAAAVAIGHRIYIFGGFDGNSEQNTMEVFDTVSESWLRFDSVTHEWGREGEDDNSNCSSSAEVRTTATRYARMPFAINEHAAVAVEPHYVLLLGGTINRSQPNEESTSWVKLYNVKTSQWEQDLPSMPYSRFLGCATYRVCNGHHTVTYCGGKPLPQAPSRVKEPDTMTLSWSGEGDDDGVNAMRAAQWNATTSQVDGLVQLLNASAVLYNYFDSSRPEMTPLRAIAGTHAYTRALRQGKNDVAEPQWCRAKATPTGTIFGVCCVE